AAGIHARPSSVSGARALARKPHGLVRVGCDRDGHRRQAHDAAVPGGVRLSGTGERITGLFVTTQRATGGVTDVEAVALHAEVAVASPTHVAVHLVARIEALFLDQALG